MFNLIKLSENQNPEIQPENNIPRWIQLPNEGPLFTNGRLVSNILESSAIGKAKNALREKRMEQQAWTFQMDVFLDTHFETFLT